MDLWSGTGWSGIESLQRIESVTTRWILREALGRASFNVNDGSRPSTLKTFPPPEQLEITRSLAKIDDQFSDFQDKSHEYTLNLKRVFSFRLSRSLKKDKEKYLPLLWCFSIAAESIEHARNSKRILDSNRNAWAVSHPVKTIPLFRSPTSASITPDSSRGNTIPARATRLCFWHLVSFVHCHP